MTGCFSPYIKNKDDDRNVSPIIEKIQELEMGFKSLSFYLNELQDRLGVIETYLDGQDEKS